MKAIKITKENAQFQILNALKTNREKRNHEGFIVEGVRNINNAILYKWNIKALFYSSNRKISSWATNILNTTKTDKHYDLSTDLLAKLSDKEEPSELLALVEIPKDDLNLIPIHEKLLVVVFDRPSSPGNLGTIIRSCDALGVDGLIITGHAVDLYDPETVSATTGSLFGLPIVRLPSQKDLELWINEIKEKVPELQVVGTDENGTSLYNFDFIKPTILLAGNEKLGLSSGYKEFVGSMVAIPMQGSASSLNVAVATSIVVSEVQRQRKFK
mgnify:CR=1 FL=1